jgi:excisionase family DNA binding protein
MVRSILLTPREVADRLRFKRTDRIYAMISGGEIKASNVGSGLRPRWRITEAEVASFIERREKAAKRQGKRANASVNAEVPRYV